MPTYVYRKRDGEKGCRHCAAQFEVVQMMADDALKTCPKCGGAVERVIVPVGIVKSTKALLGDKNLKRHGFTRFVKEEKGRYRKTT
jgi:putative FmdB family regulatory protein